MSEATIDLREDILTESFFLRVLEEKFGKDVQYISHELSLATKKGDNYVGDLIACELNVHDLLKNEGKTFHWIVKAMKQDKGSKLMELLQLFDREEAFYKDFQADLEKYVGSNFLRTVPLIFSQNEPGKQILIFEHMGFKGYRDIIDKKMGLNDAHVLSVLEWLAELHGAGYLLIQNYPGGFEEWKRNNFYSHQMPHGAMEQLYCETTKNSITTLENMKVGNENDSIVESFLSLYKDFFENTAEGMSIGNKIAKLLFEPRGVFPTLTHGDPWFNNVLAKYDEKNNLKDIILLDMQGISSGNIGSDLAYFLFGSVTYENLISKLDTYLEHYRACLSKVITDHDPKLELSLTLEDIKEDFIKSSLVGFHFSLNSLQHVLVEQKDMLQFDHSTIDWTKPEELARFLEISSAHAKKLIHKQDSLYQRMIGAVRFMMDLKAFDFLV